MCVCVRVCKTYSPENSIVFLFILLIIKTKFVGETFDYCSYISTSKFVHFVYFVKMFQIKLV